MTQLYLYGMTRAGPLPGGLAGRGIELVAADGRAAIVSPVESSPVTATRRNLLAHAEVVESLHERAIVLPARFGTVVADHDAALELLALPGVAALLDELPAMSDPERIGWDPVLMSVLSACVIQTRFKLG